MYIMHFVQDDSMSFVFSLSTVLFISGICFFTLHFTFSEDLFWKQCHEIYSKMCIGKIKMHALGNLEQKYTGKYIHKIEYWNEGYLLHWMKRQTRVPYKQFQDTLNLLKSKCLNRRYYKQQCAPNQHNRNGYILVSSFWREHINCHGYFNLMVAFFVRPMYKNKYAFLAPFI